MQSERLEELATKAEPVLRSWLSKALGAVVVAVLGVITALLGGTLPVIILVPVCGFLALLSGWLYVLLSIERGQIRQISLSRGKSDKEQPAQELSEASVSILCLLFDSRPVDLTEHDLSDRLKIGVPDVEYALRKLVKTGFINAPRIYRMTSDAAASWEYSIHDKGIDYLIERGLRRPQT